MKSKVLIIFAYSGFGINLQRRDNFWRMVKIALTRDKKPIVVINEDTVHNGGAVSFYEDIKIGADGKSKVGVTESDLDIIKIWSVDTCQMWLHGWGHIIDNYDNVDRIIQLPGDIDMVQQWREFEDNLGTFLDLKSHDIILGDFDIKEKFGPKALIDTYGTYQLLSIWFPNLTRKIFRLNINRPRTEFINIKKDILRGLLKERKFAYEQTLNMLISSYDWKKKRENAKNKHFEDAEEIDYWKHKIKRVGLGEIKDDSSYRDFIGVIDQIERTERMIKLRWREINRPNSKENPTKEEKIKEVKDYQKFIRQFQDKERLSSSCLEGAVGTIQALLGIEDDRPQF